METKIIEGELVGLRLDEALTRLGAAASRSKVKKLFEIDSVLVNGKKEKPHYKVEEGDEVSFGELSVKESKLEAEDIPLDVVYEDEDILVINKPAGLVVHPGNGHSNGTLVNGLLYREKTLSQADDPVRPGLVHRIDKDTSGLLVIAKNDDSFAYISAQLADHSMHREYLAIVKGVILEDDGKIDAPIGRDRKSPLKNCVDVKNGKEAVTYFHVEKRFRESDCTLIKCRLLTGRTHQIRVHMEYIKHPVIGDPLYGEGNRKIYKDGQLLHAYKLTLNHPKTHELVSFEAPIPDYFSEIVSKLK